MACPGSSMRHALNILLHWHWKAVKKSVHFFETTAFLTLQSIQKLVDSLFLALCVWNLKKLVILRAWIWILFILIHRRLSRRLNNVPLGCVAMCSTKACNATLDWLYTQTGSS